MSIATDLPAGQSASVGHRLKRSFGKSLWGISERLTHAPWVHDEYRRIYFDHVRKTAGTAISFAFFRLSGDPYIVERQLARFTFAQNNGYRYVWGSAALICQGKYFFAASHHPAYTVHPPGDGTFRFTILRDPIERLVSEYRYLASGAADYGLRRGAGPALRRCASEGFDNFLDVVPRRLLTNQLHMFSESGSVSEAVDRLGKLDVVMRIEEFGGDLPRLEAALQLRLSLARERSSFFHFKPTESHRSRLEDILQPEYEMLRQIRNSELHP